MISKQRKIHIHSFLTFLRWTLRRYWSTFCSWSGRCSIFSTNSVARFTASHSASPTSILAVYTHPNTHIRSESITEAYMVTAPWWRKQNEALVWHLHIMAMGLNPILYLQYEGSHLIFRMVWGGLVFPPQLSPVVAAPPPLPVKMSVFSGTSIKWWRKQLPQPPSGIRKGGVGGSFLVLNASPWKCTPIPKEVWRGEKGKVAAAKEEGWVGWSPSIWIIIGMCLYTVGIGHILLSHDYMKV